MHASPAIWIALALTPELLRPRAGVTLQVESLAGLLPRLRIYACRSCMTADCNKGSEGGMADHTGDDLCHQQHTEGLLPLPSRL